MISSIESLESRLFLSRTPGLDTSHYQGTINWASVAAAGKKFVFQKVSEGTAYVDPTVGTNTSGARNNGVLAGVYHFAHPDTNTAASEAAHFISAAANYTKPGFLQPVLDLEDGASIGKAALSQWVNDWCGAVKNSIGVDPIIYCNTNYATNYLNSTVTQWPLWIANWSTSYGDPNGAGAPPTGAGSVFSCWQYTSSGSVSGIAGNVDLDVFNGDLAQLQKFVIPGGGSIAGTVFNDVNGNGIKDTGEAGLANRSVYIDLDNDLVRDPNEKLATTDSTGKYKLSSLAAGTYKVREVLPSGWSQTTPSNGYGINVTLSTNQNATGKNFGCRQASATASISGSVFNDLNGNGVRNTGEGGLGSRTVFIDLDNDYTLDANEKRTTTDGSGNYILSGLVAGTYKVRTLQPTGWAQTTPANGYGINVTLSTGQKATGKLFGSRRIA
jgi:GH25 family lysozyme M1 (1,4-beta-N-acetylmuramidase)